MYNNGILKLDPASFDALPVPRDLVSLALLMPGVVRADPAFGNNLSFSGGAASENRVYVNGFDISNSFKSLDIFRVPFQGLDTISVQDGAISARFGRATGGMINALVRRGNNEFEAGARLDYLPASLRGSTPDVYYQDPRYPGGQRKVSDNSQDSAGTTSSATVWAGGAPIQDKLFAYGVFQFEQTTGADAFGSIFDSRNEARRSRNPGWLLKLDWMLNDNNLLELTAFGGRGARRTDSYDNPVAARGSRYLITSPASPALTPATTDLDASLATERGAYRGSEFEQTGGETYVLKYTSYLTDNFSLSAMAGHGVSRRGMHAVSANGIDSRYQADISEPASGCPIIEDVRTGTVTPIAHCDFAGIIGPDNARDTRDAFNLDIEGSLGDHLLGFGVASDRFRSVDGESYEGGAIWRYQNPVGGQPRVRKQVTLTGANVSVDSDSAYIQDRWSFSSTMTATFGLRWDRSRNRNDAGDAFTDLDMISPRLALDWSLGGEHDWFFSASAGRYMLPLANNIGVDQPSASLFTRQTYTYTGTDPVTGAPINATPVGAITYLNNAYGTTRDARTNGDQNLRPMYQDRFEAALEGALNANWNGGVRLTYQVLREAIDDTCDNRPLEAYAQETGVSFVPEAPDFPLCRLFNPGHGGVFNLDIDGNGVLERIELTAEQLGPAAKRNYKAIELYAEGHWQRGWLVASYVRSRSVGNTEGGLKSDIGQDDTGITQDFDYPELMIGSYGHLPNDRPHQFKLFGSYQFSETWSIGANLLVASGRPLNCFGYLGGQFTSAYGNSYFSCDPGVANLPGDGIGNNGSTIVPRGSVGRTPWTRDLSLSATWKPAAADGHLSLKLAIYNVFDGHAVLSVVEQGENTVGAPQPDIYLSPTSFQTPRSVQFSAAYEF